MWRRLLERSDKPVAPAATWRVYASLVLSLAGLGVSIYLTIAHYVGAGILACSDSGLVNCSKVTTSAQSHFLGMPVAVLGLAFFVVLTAFNTPWAWRSTDRRVHTARLALMVLGMAFVLYLVSAELLIIGNICIWCTSVHGITFLLFVLVMATVPGMLGWGGAGLAPADGAANRGFDQRAPRGRPNGATRSPAENQGRAGAGGPRRNGQRSSGAVAPARRGNEPRSGGGRTQGGRPRSGRPS